MKLVSITETKPAPPDGVLIIDKPTGLTSHDVVSRLRRILRTKKIGHTGTLDPFATGVLVMLVGKATRIARFLDQDKKSYSALVKFGYETDTGDRDGEAVEKDNGQLAKGIGGQELIRRIESVLPEFTGDIEQVPPMYSAKKVKGKKLYELAREGIEIEREPVSLKIYEISVQKESPMFEPVADSLVLNVTASAGTYIRTLAEDIGRRAGIGCHLAELRRLQAGNFSIIDSVSIEGLEQLAEEHRVAEKIVSMNDAICHLPQQTLTDLEVGKIANGIQIEARINSEIVQEVRLTNADHELVAIGQTTSDKTVQPRIVFKND